MAQLGGHLPPPPADDGPTAPGSVPGVRLVEELGRGAYTVVYRAERAGRSYALKVLRGPGSPRETVLLRREAALLASLDHPGLTRVYEVGEADGQPYLIMDLVEGKSLAQVLSEAGRLDEARVATLGARVATALAAAHRAGIVHRDVKPGNVMVAADGSSRVVDFGLAGRSGLDTGDAAVGTFVYSAPEQTGLLRRAVDGRADLYALGIVLFECLTGSVPFTATEVGELVRLHLSAPVPDVRDLRPDVSPALAAVISRLLAKDPDDRYQSGASLAADLERIAGGERDTFPLEFDSPFGTDDGELVGRAESLATLTARWRRTADGAGGLVLVQGPSGSGKSRLVRELVAVARSAGSMVLHGACVPDGGAPLAALRSAVDAHLRAIERMDPPGRREAEDRLRAAAGATAGWLAPLSPALTRVLGAPEQAAGGDQRHFVDAVAALLAGYAAAVDGLLFHLDDVQWADDLTQQVLRRLGTLLDGCPLLLVATARDDDAGRPGSLLAELATACDTRLTTAPLDEAGVTALATRLLGDWRVPANLGRTLAARSGGNPLAVVEWVRAVVDAGLIRPSWGSWELDEVGLQALDLPDDVMDLVLRRVDGLGAEVRRLLGVAAVVGQRFTPEVVAHACGVEPQSGRDRLAEAAVHLLVEPVPGGGYAFLHDRVREALLGGLDAADLRELHQRVADALDRPADTGVAGSTVYAVASHLLAGHPERDPQRAFDAIVAAGRQALAEHAPVDAVGFLSRAAALAGESGIGLDVRFHLDLGTAARRAGRFDLADEHLGKAIEAEADPLRRAEIYVVASDAQQQRGNGQPAIDLALRGCAELGYAIPRHPVRLALSTLAMVLTGTLIGWLPRRLRHVTGATRELYELRMRLLLAIAAGAAIAYRLDLQTAVIVRGFCLARRVGSGRECAKHVSAYAFTWAFAGMSRRAYRHLADARRMARETGDAHLVAFIEAVGASFGDVCLPTSATTGTHLRRAMLEHGRLLDVGEYLTWVGLMVPYQLLRGYVDEATHWHRRALDRAPSAPEILGSLTATLGSQVAALAGRHSDAAAQLRQVSEFVANHPNKGQQINLNIAALMLAVEQGETGEEIDRLVAEFTALKVRPMMLWSFQRMWWIHHAFARLAQLRAATGPTRAARLAVATQAVEALRKVANSPVLRAYHLAARSSLAQLGGDPAGALRRLARGAERTSGLDLPLLDYEIARIRAHAHRELGQLPDAGRQARLAHGLAAEYGWPTRARWIRTEFDLDTSSDTHRVPSRHDRRDSGHGLDLHRRRLEAIQQVSLAAATVVDARQLARVALDEIVRIFGADRAFLFLRDGDDALVPYLGRDPEGNELDELTEYGSTLVARVAADGEALVVTGSEEGAVLGSQSTLVHGLRSIMVAPLSLRGTVVGVVYLDSRAAKGLFTTDDIDILAAITNHVALSLETARAAELERAVHAAERERDVAETLRNAMTELAGSLDPGQVGRRLISIVGGILPVHRAVLLYRADGGALSVAAAHPDPVELIEDPALTRLLAASVPQHASLTDGRPVPAVLGPDTASWLAIPLVVRGEHRGLLLAGTTTRRYTDAEVEIAAALTDHAMVAYDNAWLFRRAEELAVRDGLTGLYNRRHFLELGGQHPVLDRPVATIMVDIDKFKSINDTYGHHVGDEVICEVAHRLGSWLRTGDIVCRYGGEEFAILLPDADPGIAEAVAQRICTGIAAEPVSTQAGPLPVTVSAGVADAIADGATMQSMLSRADAALYRAKRAGRNRVISDFGDRPST